MAHTRLAVTAGLHAAPRRVGVFRALQLGDMLCAVPALRALRHAWPSAHITLIGLPWASEFARRFGRYIDGFVPFPGAAGLPEREPETGALDRFYAAAGAQRFDLALQLHGDGRTSNDIVRRLGAEAIAGFHPADAPCPDPERFLAYPEGESEVRRLLRLVAFLGLAVRGEHLEFPIARPEWQALSRLRLAYGLRPSDYACVHPGARAAARRWLPERFAAVADGLAARGLRVVLTGNRAETALTAAVRRCMHGAALDLAADDMPVGVLAALLAGARFVVCNDTGVAHIAAALCVPSAVIYTGSSPARWAATDAARRRAVFHPVECRPCGHAACPIGHPCARGVTVGDVMREVGRLI